jgi:hypothetical protein
LHIALHLASHAVSLGREIAKAAAGKPNSLSNSQTILEGTYSLPIAADLSYQLSVIFNKTETRCLDHNSVSYS